MRFDELNDLFNAWCDERSGLGVCNPYRSKIKHTLAYTVILVAQVCDVSQLTTNTWVPYFRMIWDCTALMDGPTINSAHRLSGKLSCDPVLPIPSLTACMDEADRLLNPTQPMPAGVADSLVHTAEQEYGI